MAVSYSFTEIFWGTGAIALPGGASTSYTASGVYDMNNMTVGGALWLSIVNSNNTFTYPSRIFMEVSNYYPTIDGGAGSIVWYPMEGADTFTGGLLSTGGRGLTGNMNANGVARRVIMIPNSIRWMRVVAYKGSHQVTVYAKFSNITVYT